MYSKLKKSFSIAINLPDKKFKMMIKMLNKVERMDEHNEKI